MTSASELFYNRRSRLSRAAASTSSIGDLGFGLDYSADRNPRFSHHHRRPHGHHSNAHDWDACDPIRRPPHPRHHRFSHSTFQERPALASDQTIRQSALSSSNSRNVERQRNMRRPGLSAGERLPGSVLLARERLLERLRSVSLSGNRRSSRDTSSAARSEQHLLDDLWRLADANDWGTDVSTQFASSGSDSNSSILLSERTVSAYAKKPPGLSQEALDQLQVEYFGCSVVTTKSQDCSICLENFLEGDKLICLPCEHRFHSGCLDPWIRTCGDCPYCRKDVTAPTNRN